MSSTYHRALILKRLLAIKEDIQQQRYPNDGLCFSLRRAFWGIDDNTRIEDAMLECKHIMCQWEHAVPPSNCDGNRDYLVPACMGNTNCNDARLAYRSSFLLVHTPDCYRTGWDMEHPYGQMRMLLLDYLIERYEQFKQEVQREYRALSY